MLRILQILGLVTYTSLCPSLSYSVTRPVPLCESVTSALNLPISYPKKESRTFINGTQEEKQGGSSKGEATRQGHRPSCCLASQEEAQDRTGGAPRAVEKMGRLADPGGGVCRWGRGACSGRGREEESCGQAEER